MPTWQKGKMKYSTFDKIQKKYPWIAVHLGLPILMSPHVGYCFIHTEEEQKKFIEERIGYIAFRPFSSLNLQNRSSFEFDEVKGIAKDLDWTQHFTIPPYKKTGHIYVVLGHIKKYFLEVENASETPWHWTTPNTEITLRETMILARQKSTKWMQDYEHDTVLKISWTPPKRGRGNLIHSLDIYPIPKGFKP